MKYFSKMVAIMLLMVVVVSCSTSEQIMIDGTPTEVPYYGLGTLESEKRDDVVYEVAIRNTIIGLLFSGSLIVPISVVGWNIMKPVRQKSVDEM